MAPELLHSTGYEGGFGYEPATQVDHYRITVAPEDSYVVRVSCLREPYRDGLRRYQAHVWHQDTLSWSLIAEDPNPKAWERANKVEEDADVAELFGEAIDRLLSVAQTVLTG